MALPGNTEYNPDQDVSAKIGAGVSDFASGLSSSIAKVKPAPNPMSGQYPNSINAIQQSAPLAGGSTIGSLDDNQLKGLVTAMGKREGFGADPTNRPTRNNNPLNIKYGGATKKWVDQGLATIEPSKAADGGNFLVFKDPQTGLQAAQELLRSDIYSGMPVDAALRKWSGGGYGAEIYPMAQASGAPFNAKGMGTVTTEPGSSTRFEANHPGIDIAGIGNIPAFTGGTVTEVSTGHKQGDPGYGNYIIIQDIYGNKHRYSHLKQAWVKVGEQVSPGAIIGAEGNTGQTYSRSGGSGAHLDYRVVNVLGKYVNPRNFVSA